MAVQMCSNTIINSSLVTISAIILIHIYLPIYTASEFDNKSLFFVGFFLCKSKASFKMICYRKPIERVLCFLNVSFCVWKFSIISIDCTVCVALKGWVLCISLDREKNFFLLQLMHSCHCNQPSQAII